MSCASTAHWNADNGRARCGRPHRGLEIAGIVLGFIFVWPVALAYLVWKLLGYPVPNELKSFVERNFSYPFEGVFSAPRSYRNTGNRAFEDYRRGELARLEAERRRLDEESRAFGEFVDELKRAKDREEFDAFMRKRRDSSAGPAAAQA